MATNIDPAPPAPNRLQPSDFATRAANFVAWMESLTPAINDLANETEVNAQIAADAAANPNTSTTSLTIGTGNKSLVTDTGIPFYIGQVIRIIYADDGTQFMQGDITAYDSGTGDLTVNVDSTGGSGTFSDWVIASTFGLGQLRQDGASNLDQLRWNNANGEWEPFKPDPSPRWIKEIEIDLSGKGGSFIVNNLPTSKQYIRFVFTDVESDTDDVQISVQRSIDNGSSFVTTSDYRYALRDGIGGQVANEFGQTQWTMEGVNIKGTSSIPSSPFVFDVPGLIGMGDTKSAQMWVWGTDQIEAVDGFFYTLVTDGGQIDAFKFFLSSGTFQAGRLQVWSAD